MSVRPLTTVERTRFGWIEQGPPARVMAALEAARPGSSKFVGGCVRDSLVGVAPKDVDVATILTPDAVIAALGAAGLGAAPTGLAHGTVTAICDHVGLEVTTLRADVATDGRRATVAFTDDWRTDAFRRDFTINALYLSSGFDLFDYAQGADDLAAGRVRFIGDAEARIREDYLRILRFFRFSARFAASFDAIGLSACAALRGGVAQLSAERVGDELQKILQLARAPVAVEAMASTGVLSAVWPAAADLGEFARLKARRADAPPALGLAALFGPRGEGVDAALRLSNAVAERRRASLAAAATIDLGMSARSARAAQYRHGARAFADALDLAAARENAEPPRALLDVAARPAPIFPVSGRDVLAAGVPAGPRVSSVLAAVESAWIAEDFPPTDRAHALIKEAVANGA